MQSRTWIWPTLVVLLLGLLFIREPRLEQSEDIFLRWLLKNSQPQGPNAPLTVVEIGSDPLLDSGAEERAESNRHATALTVSPLEFALFLQSILDFKPMVVAFENLLRWRERDKDQEQVFLDQAMRVPRMLVAAELTANPDPDSPGPEIPGFTQVSGKRGDLVEFSGISHQPGEDIRLISTGGFINLPEELDDGVHVPLLFRYRGEVIPSFAFEAVLLWLRVTPGEVKINLDSHIELPEGRKIPIRSDGTMLVAPNAAKKARRLSLNQLLVAAQQHDSGQESADNLETLRDDIVLVRTPANPLSPPDIFAATIATIQKNSFIRRVSWIFDCVILVMLTALSSRLHKCLKIDVLLGAIAFTAGYCMIALAVVSRWQIWLPGILPIGAAWLLAAISILSARRARITHAAAVALPPPVP